jgi:hypothetical protein
MNAQGEGVRNMKPHWPDHCEHNRPRDCFLGTIEHDGETFDVFVYQDNALADVPDMHVCMRYGAEGSEYISPGPIAHFLDVCAQFPQHTVYQLAKPLVEEYQRTERT